MNGSVTAEIVVTSFHPSPIGGGITVGRDTDGELHTVLTPLAVLARDPEPGESWRVTGYMRSGDRGPLLQASVALPLLPTGGTLVRFLATNRTIRGVGWKTARYLFETFGERLYDVLVAGDANTLAKVVGVDRAAEIVQGFGMLADEVEVLRWLDRYGVSPRTAAAAVSIWGRGAIDRISADPYALALLESWEAVDTRALRLGLSPGDPRRLLGAAEESFSRRYRVCETAVSEATIKVELQRLLEPDACGTPGEILQQAVAAGRAIRTRDGFYQSRAAWFMEREVERVIAERLATSVEGPSAAAMRSAIAALEAEVGYQLGRRQREAVYMAVSSSVSILCGGAGTGKTTTVRAVLGASSAAGLTPQDHVQAALAGRAAKRIAEATGRPAMTIARLLRNLDVGKDVPRHGLLCLDEASMIDLPTVYRLLTTLPRDVAILFIGDPAQLPPIGPGLPFHRMVESAVIPLVELDVTHRQASETGIPQVAGAVREGRFPRLPSFDPARPEERGVFLQAAETGGLATAAMKVFEAMVGDAPAAEHAEVLHVADVQILCAAKSGPDGSRAINDRIESRWMAHQRPVHDWGLSVGSKILWLKNDYAKAPMRSEDGEPMKDSATSDLICAGFMNGSLGVVRRPTTSGAWVRLDDGAEDEITRADLEKVTRGWGDLGPQGTRFELS